MKKINPICSIFAALFGAVGIILRVRWGNYGNPNLYLIAFLPATAFVLTCICINKWKQKIIRLIFVLLCCTVFICAGGFIFGIEMFLAATAEVTNINKYDGILKDYWNNSDLVSHFPRPIPADAKNIRLSFSPAFLQGGAHIQLRYSTSAEKISEVYGIFSEKKTKSFFGGNTNDHMNQYEGMPTTSFYTSDSNLYKFPDDYEIMIFDKVLKIEERPEGFYWNHGQSHGVVISKKENEIVYWAESW